MSYLYGRATWLRTEAVVAAYQLYSKTELVSAETGRRASEPMPVANRHLRAVPRDISPKIN